MPLRVHGRYSRAEVLAAFGLVDERGAPRSHREGVLWDEASHIKPWRDCDNRERLSGANGLLLSPHVDKLFARHWISFDSEGQLLCQHEAARKALRCWGIEGANLIRPFSREQERFLDAHREMLRH